MNKDGPYQHIHVPLGAVEPHASLLIAPSEEQRIYKMMTVENLLRSMSDNYLHFNRVDGYKDFPGADVHDGQQLPKDQDISALARFEKAPDFSAKQYYDQSRARTYACCFSLANSDYIWRNYANGSARGKVCVVMLFGRLRAMLNPTLRTGNALITYNGRKCHQIFDLNYGTVKYIDWETQQAHDKHLVNPIRYTYLKDRRYSQEEELRISLSALGLGQYTVQFPCHLHLAFNFQAALANGTIEEILDGPDTDFDFLEAELRKFHIVARRPEGE